MKLITTFLLILLTITSFSQDYSKQRKLAEEKFYAGDVNGAIEISQKLVQSSQKKFGDKHREYGKSLEDLGVYEFYNGNFSKADQLLQQAESVYVVDPGKKSKEYANCLSNHGLILYMNNYYRNAEKKLDECIEIYRAINFSDSLDFIMNLSNLGEVKRKVGKVNEAEILFLRSKKGFEVKQMEETIEYATLCNNLANLYHDKTDYTNAEIYYQLSMRKFAKVSGENSADFLNAKKNYGILLIDRGRYDDAKIIIEEVQKKYAASPGKTSVEYAGTVNDLGNLFDKSGNYKQAEKFYLEAISIKKSSGNNEGSLWISMNNLANLYGKLGDPTKGIKILEDVLASMKQRGDDNTPDYANYLNSLASLEERNISWNAAMKHYNESLTIVEKLYGREHPDYSRVLNNQALILMREKKYDQSMPLYLQSLEILEKDSANNQKEIAETWINLGELNSLMKDYSSSEKYLNKAISYYRNNLTANHPDYWIAISNLGLLYYRKGDIAKAKEIEKQVQDLGLTLLNNNFEFLTETEKRKYYFQMMDQFEFFNSFCLKAYNQFPGITADMFDYTLETKSLILYHSRLLRKKINESGNKELIDKYKSWELKREKLAGYYNLKKSELKRNNIDINALEQEVNQLEKELTLASNEFADLRQEKKKTWKDIRDKLKPNEAAVELLRVEIFENEWTDSIVYVALIVTKEMQDKPAIVILQDGKKLEKKYFSGYINAVKYNKMSTLFYDVYWKEIDKYLKGKDLIYLSPAGVYNKISIPTLKTPEGKYILETKQIQVMPGLRHLISSIPVRKKSGFAALYGYPTYNLNLNEIYGKRQDTEQNISREVTEGYELNELPGTKVEVEKIYGILEASGYKPQKYMEAKALESSVKELKDPEILHIATHGYFLSDQDIHDDSAGISHFSEKSLENPLLRSGLMLAGATNTLNYSSAVHHDEDGVLTAFEAMHLNLSNTEMVVLSACETGLGEELNGEGVFGLQRAFQVAGARNVLMSLWQVSDEGTQQLMTLFYKNLAMKKSPAVAFRDAQLELMKTFSSPYYWGAFVFVGN